MYKPEKKRKRVVLTLEEKLEVIQQRDKGRINNSERVCDFREHEYDNFVFLLYFWLQIVNK